jgi:hypothetical protein
VEIPGWRYPFAPSRGGNCLCHTDAPLGWCDAAGAVAGLNGARNMRPAALEVAR